MAEGITWAPYTEKMQEQLNQLALKEIHQDLTVGRTLKAYTADKNNYHICKRRKK